LSDDDVETIRLLAGSIKAKLLAEMYGIRQNHIYRLRNKTRRQKVG
jgi:hypothetical protein